MKPSIDQIKTALEQEARSHMLQVESLRVDIPPAILTPHQTGYKHAVRCNCGHLFELVTQHSGKIAQGAMELQAAMMADYAEHFRASEAQTIYLMYDGTQ